MTALSKFEASDYEVRMKEIGISRTDLESAFGVSKATVYRWFSKGDLPEWFPFAFEHLVSSKVKADDGGDKTSDETEGLVEESDFIPDRKRIQSMERSVRDALFAIKAKRDGDVAAISSGFVTLDNNWPGWLSPGRMTVVAAEPGLGKTNFVQQVAENVAEEDEVLFFSLEMSHTDISLRMLSRLTGIDFGRMFTGQLSDPETSTLVSALDKLGPMLDNFESITGVYHIDDIRSIALARAKEARKKGRRIGAIVVDYMQIASAKGDSEIEIIKNVSIGLATLAQQAEAPVIAVSQYNRAGSSNSSNAKATHLKGSSQIEQDAALVLGLSKPDSKRLKVAVLKSRFGIFKDQELHINPVTNQIGDMIQG